MPAPTTYSKTQLILHWGIVLLVLFQILVHNDIQRLWFQRMRGDIPNVPTFHLHAAVGILILGLMLWRLVLRLKRGVPAGPSSEPGLFKFGAAASHWLFYLLLLAIPASGLVAWFGGISSAALVHYLSEKLLLLLIAAHVGAALLHHYWFKTDVLKRIFGRA